MIIPTIAPLPHHWHLPRMTEDGRCAVCACPIMLLRFARRYTQHRRTRPDEAAPTPWVKRLNSRGGWKLFFVPPAGGPAAPTSRRRKICGRIRDQIDRATALLAAGRTLEETAGSMRVDRATLRRFQHKHATLWQTALDRARAQREALDRIIVERTPDRVSEGRAAP